MKILINVKTTLRSMVATGVITIAFFILFPIALAGFMGFLESSTSDGLKLNVIDMVIEDQDNSEMSKELVTFLNSDSLKDIVSINDKTEKDTSKLVIPAGYGEDLMSQKKNNITVNCNNSDDSTAINVLKIVLDNYHQGIYGAISSGDTDKLQAISAQSAIESQNIMVDKEDKKEMYAVLIFEFVVSMLLYTLIEGSYAKESKALAARLNATPISFNELFLCDWVSYLVYTFIIMTAYVTVFRITNIAFQGNIFMMLGLISMASLFITSMANGIVKLLGEEIAKVAGIILFILPVVGMKMFTGKGNIISKFAPTGYVVKAFESYFITGNINEAYKYIFVILGVSLLITAMVLVKGVIVERRKKICA